jgi:uncharacterized membrane protein YeaQ/YmgE (transglycosylase-associated protein family)
VRPTVEDLASAFFTAAVSVLLAAPVGLLWSALAPHARVQITAAGSYFTGGESEVFVAADGWFVGVTLLAGLLLGVLSWLAARGSGPYVVLGLAVGGLAAGWVAAKVGARPHHDALLRAAATGAQGSYVANVALQAWQVVVAWPVAALGAFLALVAARPDELR